MYLTIIIQWQGSLACCSPWGHKESDPTEWLNWTDRFSDPTSLFSLVTCYLENTIKKKKENTITSCKSIPWLHPNCIKAVNGNPLQYSYRKNPMDRGAWQATAQSVAKSRTQLSNWSTAQASSLFSSTMCVWKVPAMWCSCPHHHI